LAYATIVQDSARIYVGFRSSIHRISAIFAEYIQASMERAKYKLIDNLQPDMGIDPELEDVWATGNIVEKCPEVVDVRFQFRLWAA
jgi:hypothetical protein